MRIFKSSVLIMSALAAFSCVKDDKSGAVDNRRVLSISIKAPQVRSIDDPVPDKAATEIASLQIYLTDGINVLDHDAISTKNEISEFIATGKTYGNISSAVTEVLIVANNKSSDILPVNPGATVADIKNFKFGLTAQQPDEVHSENRQAAQVTMMAWSGLTDTGKVTSDGYKEMIAKVTLKPIVGRMEISGAPQAGVGIKDIVIDNIWINKYYPTGDCSADDIINNGTDIAAYAGNLQNTFGKGSENLVAITSGGRVDAYHLFSNQAQTVAMPHIVVRVSGHYVDATGEQGNAFAYKYITVKRFVKEDGVVENLLPNNIYKVNLSSLTVNAAGMDDKPEAESISLSVSIEVEEWTANEVTPEI